MGFLVALFLRIAFAVLIPLAILCAVAAAVLFGVIHVIDTPSTWQVIAGIALAVVGLIVLNVWAKMVRRKTARR